MVYEHSNVVKESESHTGDESDTTHSNCTAADSRRTNSGSTTSRTINGSNRYLQVARPQHLLRSTDPLENNTHNSPPRLGSIKQSNHLVTPNQSPEHLMYSSKEENSKYQGSCSTTLSTTPLVEDTCTDAARDTLLVCQDSSITTRGQGLTHSSSSEHIRRFLAEKQKISLTKERRVARTMAVIMGAFVACWLPFFLMYVIFPFCSYCAVNTDPRVINFLVWLGYANSTLNPIIYTVFNVDFRRAFKILLRIDRAHRRRLY